MKQFLVFAVAGNSNTARAIENNRAGPGHLSRVKKLSLQPIRARGWSDLGCELCFAHSAQIVISTHCLSLCDAAYPTVLQRPSNVLHITTGVWLVLTARLLLRYGISAIHCSGRFHGAGRSLLSSRKPL